MDSIPEKNTMSAAFIYILYTLKPGIVMFSTRDAKDINTLLMLCAYLCSEWTTPTMHMGPHLFGVGNM